MRSSTDGAVYVSGRRVVRVRKVRCPSLPYVTYAVSDLHSPGRLFEALGRWACEDWAKAQGYRVLGPHEAHQHPALAGKE